MMTLKRVEAICSQFRNKKILIFGDVILDRYIFGSVSRISPEAPVPVVKVEKEEFRPGGAGNVAANIDKLGAGSILLGVTGKDSFAHELFKLKSQDNAIITSAVNQTLVKTRVISQRQQIVRIDREETIRVTPEIRDKIGESIEKLKPTGIDGIIVSDYAKGTLTLPLMECLKDKAQSFHVPIIVDPKPPHFHLYKDIDGITPNRREAEAIMSKKIDCDAGAAEAVKFIRRRFNAKFSLITRGNQGITAGEKGKKVFHLPAFNHEVFDVTGAGDTVISVLILALVSAASLKEAVELANAAASIVVEKVGTSQITVDELHERMRFLSKK